MSTPIQSGFSLGLGQGFSLTPQSVRFVDSAVSVTSWAKNWPNVITMWVKFAWISALSNTFLLTCLAFGRGSGPPENWKVENCRGWKFSPSYAEGTKRRWGVKAAPVVMLQRLLHVPSNVRYLPCLRHSNLLLSETWQFVRLNVSSSSWAEGEIDASGASYQPMKSSIPKRKLH